MSDDPPIKTNEAATDFKGIWNFNGGNAGNPIPEGTREAFNAMVENPSLVNAQKAIVLLKQDVLDKNGTGFSEADQETAVVTAHIISNFQKQASEIDRQALASFIEGQIPDESQQERLNGIIAANANLPITAFQEAGPAAPSTSEAGAGTPESTSSTDKAETKKTDTKKPDGPAVTFEQAQDAIIGMVDAMNLNGGKINDTNRDMVKSHMDVIQQFTSEANARGDEGKTDLTKLDEWAIANISKKDRKKMGEELEEAGLTRSNAAGFTQGGFIFELLNMLMKALGIDGQLNGTESLLGDKPLGDKTTPDDKTAPDDKVAPKDKTTPEKTTTPEDKTTPEEKPPGETPSDQKPEGASPKQAWGAIQDTAHAVSSAVKDGIDASDSATIADALRDFTKHSGTQIGASTSRRVSASADAIAGMDETQLQAALSQSVGSGEESRTIAEMLQSDRGDLHVKALMALTHNNTPDSARRGATSETTGSLQDALLAADPETAQSFVEAIKLGNAQKAAPLLHDLAQKALGNYAATGNTTDLEIGNHIAKVATELEGRAAQSKFDTQLSTKLNDKEPPTTIATLLENSADKSTALKAAAYVADLMGGVDSIEHQASLDQQLAGLRLASNTGGKDLASLVNAALDPKAQIGGMTNPDGTDLNTPNGPNLNGGPSGPYV